MTRTAIQLLAMSVFLLLVSCSGLRETSSFVPAVVRGGAAERAGSVASAAAPDPQLSLFRPDRPAKPVAGALGPALYVDAAAATHAISPLIYGMNAFNLDPTVATAVGLSINRWGGNGTSRYNYKLDVANIGADWYFETLPNSNTDYPNTSEFNTRVAANQAIGAKTMGTVPVIGWTAKRARGCSFSVAKYGAQAKTDQWFPDCGNGVKPDGTTLVTGNDPNDTSVPIVNETWAGEWVSFLAGKFGTAGNGGVAVYSLDNEPTWWDANHRDVHPLPFTYDEITGNGLKVAKAVKAADPTAEVSGPVIDFWPAFFYSMKDIRTGWSTGPNWVYNGNPVDRNAHNGVPLLEYYLQKFHQAEVTDGVRYLDYLDLHTYFAANNGAFQTAGTPAQQLVLIDSTRAFWDPTYLDPNPHNFTDPDDTSGSPRQVAPMIIPRMKKWIADNYPGTKIAITEYNWGAQEDITGAVAQADILGIFGREGVDLATLWGPPDPVTQKPGMMAFRIFRNYDGAGSEFGNLAISAASVDQSKLAIYAALRGSDNVLTIVVINKTYSDLEADLPLVHFTAAGAAKVYQYSTLDLNSIRRLGDVILAAPAGSTTTLNEVYFPAMSITLFAIPRA